jgi:hypothetical protein
MAGFIQIIEFTTTRFDEGEKLVQEYRAATEGRRTTIRGMSCNSRDEENRYFTIVEFPSYEAAMKNSELPETQKLSEGLSKLGEGPPVFHNLDVVSAEVG